MSTTSEAVGVHSGDTSTPRPDRRRRIAAWIAIALVLIGVGTAGSLLAGIGQWTQRDVLDPESAGANGSRALVQILGEHGIDVVVVRDRAAAENALAGGPATLALTDAPALSDEALETVTDAAADVVVLDPRSRTLRVVLGGGIAQGFNTGGAARPDCDVRAAVRAGSVAPGALFSPEEGMQACYPVDDGWGLLSAPHGSGTAVAVDARELFTNGNLARNGNAALAVNLLGGSPTLVWYMPGLADSDLAAGDRTLGELTPPWVSPVIVLLLVAALAAAIWRGRRFGPLVSERLPVTVRGSETAEGRARLYAEARDPLHAADQLRIGALGRLARLLGLGAAASADEIADAAASRSGADRGTVHGVLITELPSTDADLLSLSSRLRALENAVRAAVRPERTPE
ncbi:DUF4350 domain-containing protein [Microbacterium pygmaeum]|uniref:DUF4350 domain-containing protein n=1 Tax=Microbacterium pygmaeum TaxID=370764 RepID=A0A1G8CMR1_9MICO|nr:DUF4350 domain-containing protein [Microbacterium pygmaeum]SDH46831.1 protein of unknown function [Microbacterium pygmaeum]